MTTEIKERREQEQAESDRYANVLNTDRYKIIGELGRGTWGVVYKAKDEILGREVAIKVLEPSETAKAQMRERNLGSFEAMQKEWALAPCANVVPRSFEVDGEGKPYIVMPVYGQFLEGALNDNRTPDKRTSVRNGLSLENAIGIMTDTANGLAEMHEKMKRVHGDLKPDNIALDENGHALINDLGTSTCASFFGRSDSPRDNMGCINTRAYECFDDKNGHPSKGSDAYAWAALAYRIFSGEYPWEDEIANSENPGQYFAQLGSEKINTIVKKKVRKNVPRKFRKIIEKGLRFDNFERQCNGGVLQRELGEVVENLNFVNTLKKGFRKWTVYVGIPVAFAAALFYKVATYEPQKLSMPEQPRINGMLYKDNRPLKDGERIEFETENIKGLPETIKGGMLIAGQAEYAKHATDNRVIAYLIKAAGQAAVAGGTGWGGANITTDYQCDMYLALTSPDERRVEEIRCPGRHRLVWAKCLEDALHKSRTKDGKVDLEDTLVISRIGVGKVLEAQRISRSQDYEKYREAKDAKGNLIIPKEERGFVDLWLAYYHADVD